jgi:hypothetical protein
MSKLCSKKVILTVYAAMGPFNQNKLEVGSWARAVAMELAIGPAAGSDAGGLARLTA